MKILQLQDACSRWRRTSCATGTEESSVETMTRSTTHQETDQGPRPGWKKGDGGGGKKAGMSGREDQKHVSDFIALSKTRILVELRGLWFRMCCFV